MHPSGLFPGRTPLVLSVRFSGGSNQYRIRCLQNDAIRLYSPCQYDRVVLTETLNTSQQWPEPDPVRGPYVGRESFVGYKESNATNERDIYTSTDLVPEFSTTGSGNYDGTVTLYQHDRTIQVTGYSWIAVRAFGKKNADGNQNTAGLRIMGWSIPAESEYGPVGRMVPFVLWQGVLRLDGAFVGNTDNNNGYPSSPMPDDPLWDSVITGSTGTLNGPWWNVSSFDSSTGQNPAGAVVIGTVGSAAELWIPTAGSAVLSAELYDLGSTAGSPDEALAMGLVYRPIATGDPIQ